MSLSEIFSDPLEPNRSIQLNNRYWPGEKFGLLSLIYDAEALLETGDLAGAARELRRLKVYFPAGPLFARFLRRLHRLHCFRSRFGYITGRVAIAAAVVEANQYSGSASRASYPLAEPASFAGLMKDSAKIYKDEYGGDLLRMNCSVRFARPDERQADVLEFGLLSDYHNDEYKGISTIVYLSDVTDETGAFSFIAGSHLIRRSLVLTAIHQCVEFDMLVTKPEELAHFPLEFRGSVGIGNFLDEEKADVMHRFRNVLEGGVGTFVTFNGQYVLHRGGKPLSGSRTAAFLQPEGMLRHKIKSIGSALFGIIGV